MTIAVDQYTKIDKISLISVMNVVIVHECMIKERALNVGTSAVIVGLLVQPIINVVDLGAILHLEVEMKKCIIDTIDIKNGHTQRSVVKKCFYV